MEINEIIKKLKSDAITDSYNFQGYSMKQKEQIAEWLEELQFVRQWKLDVMEGFCRYDASSFEEIAHNVRNKTINEFVGQIMEYCSMSDMNKKMIRQIAEHMKTQ